MSKSSDEETDELLIADHRNFYKVEKWTKDGSKVDHMLYAGSNLDKAQAVFVAAIKHRPRIRLTIRQRTQVLSSGRCQLDKPPLLTYPCQESEQ